MSIPFEIEAEVQRRTASFLDHLAAMLEASAGFESEIAETIKEQGAGSVTDFVQDAADACSTLGQIAFHVLNGARVRLPKPPKVEADPDDPSVIRFPARTGGEA